MEYNHKSKITARYIHGLGIDEPLAGEKKHRTYYYHADGLGSIVALTDSNQKVVQTYEYDSFGNLKDQEERIKQPYTFKGREYDLETGLYYYRARYYDSLAGIFTQRDLTGHLVLTILHTNNTVATITRLIDSGIPPYLINSAVSGVLAQRLVRRFCNNCKVESEVPGDLSSLIDYYGLPGLTSCCRSTGCPEYFNTGY